MGVAAQILEHKLGATEGWFQIDDPFLSVQGLQPGGKGLGLSQEREVSVEAELAVTEGLLEGVDKTSAKDLTQHRAGKEVPLGCGNPVGVIKRQPGGDNDTMDMRVGSELLTPGAQNAEEADLYTEMFGIVSGLRHRGHIVPDLKRKWRARRDSNPRPSASKADALSS